jgi:hypothetical protein
MNSSETRHILLQLDLSTDNPVPLDAVRARLPPDADVRPYRMTEFGAERMPFGSRDSGWHLWARSFDAMLRQARSDCEDGEHPVHFHVVGRAALPMAAYAGLALSGSARLTVYNPRRKTMHVDHFPLIQPTHPPAGDFFTIDKEQPLGEPEGMLALFVGAGQPFELEAITSFFRKQGTACAAVAQLNCAAEEQPVLDADRAPGALWQITRRLLDLRAKYGRSQGLTLFCAGPFSLALAVGWAINPRIYNPVWMPNFDAGVYKPTLQFPRSAPRHRKPRILILTAAPQNEAHVDLQTQLRVIDDALAPVRERCDVQPHLGMRARDLAGKLRSFNPDIVHILAHGTDKGGLFAVTPNEDLQAVEIIQREIVEALRHGDPPPRLIVLHTCTGGATAEALASHFDTTIGSTKLLWQDTAAAFSAEFYGALAEGLNIRRAYDRTKLNLGMIEARGIADIEAYHCPEGDRGEWTPFPRG